MGETRGDGRGLGSELTPHTDWGIQKVLMPLFSMSLQQVPGSVRDQADILPTSSPHPPTLLTDITSHLSVTIPRSLSW